MMEAGGWLIEIWTKKTFFSKCAIRLLSSTQRKTLIFHKKKVLGKKVLFLQIN